MIHISQERGGGTSHQTGPCGEAPESVGGQQGRGENRGRSLYCGFLGNEWGRQGEQAKQVQDWLVWIILVVSGYRAVSDRPVPGPGLA